MNGCQGHWTKGSGWPWLWGGPGALGPSLEALGSGWDGGEGGPPPSRSAELVRELPVDRGPPLSGSVPQSAFLGYLRGGRAWPGVRVWGQGLGSGSGLRARGQGLGLGPGVRVWGQGSGSALRAWAQGLVPVRKLPGKLLLGPVLTLLTLVGPLGGLHVHRRRGLSWGSPFSHSCKTGGRSQSGPGRHGFPLTDRPPLSAEETGRGEGCELPVSRGPAQHPAPGCLLCCVYSVSVSVC